MLPLVEPSIVTRKASFDSWILLSLAWAVRAIARSERASRQWPIVLCIYAEFLLSVEHGAGTAEVRCESSLIDILPSGMTP